jgi:polyhydroxyalkanoate synthesis regulator phasin
MSSQVISYRLSTDEVLALRQKALPGESDNQAAQRLMREVLGLSTEVSTQSTLTLDERIESIVEDRLSSFVANQNDLLSCLQERLQELEAQIASLSLADDRPSLPLPVDKVDRSVDDADNEHDRLPVDSAVDIVDDKQNHLPPTLVDNDVDNTVDIIDETLTQAELGKRLGVDPATLSKNRAKANFPEWSQGKDPKGMAWRYLPEAKRYIPVLSTPSTDVDMEQGLVGDRWKSRVDEVVASL